jgi:uncharacterized protein YbjT (DUF2867 family)
MYSATSLHRPARVLVVGASRGTGKATVDALLRAGHRVTAFSRSADALPRHEHLTCVAGDATRQADVDAAVAGQDAVVVTLGISENPIGVRLFGSRKTPARVRSDGTATVIRAMKRHGVERLVVLSSFGTGETRRRLRVSDRVLFALLLEGQMADTERQEGLVRDSGLAWSIAQPVHLTNDDSVEPAFPSEHGTPRGWRVSRRQVGTFLAQAVAEPTWVGKSVALSG